MRMQCVALVLLALIWAGDRATAQAQGGAPNMAQAHELACNRTCVTQFRSCAASGSDSAKLGACNTYFILCIPNCREGTSALTPCETDGQPPEQAFDRCRPAYLECRQKLITALKDPARTQIIFEGGDGSALEAAVIIRGAKNEFEGIAAESLWSGVNHPEWRKHGQALLNQNGKAYDRIDYLTADGAQAAIYFDITGFFGKL